MAITLADRSARFNEARHVCRVLDEVLRYSPEVLVVDDGSTDDTGQLLAQRGDIRVATHNENRGYGAALLTAFQYAAEHQYDVLVTIDCDGQHEPQRIPRFVAACEDVDIVSGSRYLKRFRGYRPPEQRRRINEQLTAELNQRLGLSLTDAFCGFKAYRVEALQTAGAAGNGLCDAVGVVGPGGGPSVANHRVASATDLSGGRTIVWRYVG